MPAASMMLVKGGRNIWNEYADETTVFKKLEGRQFPESSYTMMPIATNLTLAQERALEQTIITAYGIDTLDNMINSILPSKWNRFKRECKHMKTLIQSFEDPE